MKISIKKNKNKSTTSDKNEFLPYFVKIRFAECIRLGMSVESAAALCDITSYRLGQLRSDPDFNDFINKHKAIGERDQLANMDMAGKLGQWKSSDRLLQFVNSERYGKQETVIRHEYELKLGVWFEIIKIALSSLDISTRKRVMDAINQASSNPDIVEMKQLPGGESNFSSLLKVA